MMLPYNIDQPSTPFRDSLSRQNMYRFTLKLFKYKDEASYSFSTWLVPDNALDNTQSELMCNPGTVRGPKVVN